MFRTSNAACVVLIIAAMMLSACGSGRPEIVEDALANVCRATGSGDANVATAIVNAEGARVSGSITASAIVQYRASYAALAQTDGSFRRTEAGPGVCCTRTWFGGIYCGYQPVCVRDVSHDLTDIFGLARGKDRAEAEEAAIEGCQELAAARAREIGASSSRRAFQCKIIRSSLCS